MTKKSEERLAALLSAKDAGIIHGAEMVNKRYLVQVFEETPPRNLDGPQVDAFLFGIRLGQINADKKFARTT